MSGGALTDDGSHSLYNIEYWADKLESYNPMLSEMLRDMGALLDRYDYYMSGDTGKESVERAWGEFKGKWMNLDDDKVAELAKRYLERMAQSMEKGHMEVDR